MEIPDVHPLSADGPPALGEQFRSLCSRHPGLLGSAIVVAIHLLATMATGLAAVLVGAPFTFWFRDTPILLLVTGLNVLFFGVVWDGCLVAIGLAAEWVRRRTGRPFAAGLSVEQMRGARFFTCGPWPTVIFLITAFSILGTSNITLISLKLLRGASEWRDPLFWALEGKIFEWLVRLPIQTSLWDSLYHSSWTVLFFAVFVMTLMRRGSDLVLRYCVSMVMLFYSGRLIGLLTPVMGPAFYRPDLFAYLQGSVSQSAIHYIETLMSLSPAAAMEKGGVLVGGVSAVPSLHVGMVMTTAIWLAVGWRKSLYVTVPWVLMIWTSTILLGWHYIVDGVGGLVLGGVCAWASQRLVQTILRLVAPHTPANRHLYSVNGSSARRLAPSSSLPRE